MTKTKCRTGTEKCIAFYSETYNQREKTSHLSDYNLGIPQIKSVINVYKTELEK